MILVSERSVIKGTPVTWLTVQRRDPLCSLCLQAGRGAPSAFCIAPKDLRRRLSIHQVGPIQLCSQSLDSDSVLVALRDSQSGTRPTTAVEVLMVKLGTPTAARTEGFLGEVVDHGFRLVPDVSESTQHAGTLIFVETEDRTRQTIVVRFPI